MRIGTGSVAARWAPGAVAGIGPSRGLGFALAEPVAVDEPELPFCDDALGFADPPPPLPLPRSTTAATMTAATPRRLSPATRRRRRIARACSARRAWRSVWFIAHRFPVERRVDERVGARVALARHGPDRPAFEAAQRRERLLGERLW